MVLHTLASKSSSARLALAGAVLVVVAGSMSACDDYSELRGSLGPADQARFERGRRAATLCWSCHDVVGSGSKIGPPLGGSYGRRAGSVPGYPYSPAMQSSSLIWNQQSLDSFLASPQRVIPGNRMVSPALTDAGHRADLVFFLSQVTRPVGQAPDAARAD